MRASRVIKIQIARPYDEVYDFVATPGNLMKWAAAPGGRMVHVGGDTWQIDVPAGRVLISLSPRNAFGVLDYATRTLGTSVSNRVPVRLYRNGEGADLIMVWRKRPDDSEERFASDVEWVTSDLERLKSLLEAAGQAPAPALRTGRAMFTSQVILVQINRPYDEVYAFLADPTTFPSWASNLGSTFAQISETDWATETRRGRVIIRFARRNPYGILDHAVFLEGEEPVTTPMRLVENDGCAEIVYTLFGRPGQDAAAVRSEVEWITSDFQALRSMLEARGEPDVAFATSGPAGDRSG